MTLRDRFEKETNEYYPCSGVAIDYWHNYALWLEQEFTWKKVEDGLPTETKHYLCRMKYGEGTILTQVVYFYSESKHWDNNGGIIFEYMEIPEGR